MMKKKNQILLIVPPLINGGIAFTREGRCQERAEVLGSIKPPLTLAYLAAIFLKNGIIFRLVDATAQRLDKDQIERELGNFVPDLVIFPSTTPTIEDDTANLLFLKKKFGAKLFTLGPHSTAIPEETLRKLPALDGIILHDVEETAQEIARTPFDQLKNIKGLYFRLNGRIVETPRREQIKDLDKLPYPAWEYFSLEKYQMPILGKSYLLVETSRGCPFGCDFCVVSIIHGLNFRQRQSKKVVDEIEYMKNRFKIETFYLWGDTVTLDEKFILSLANEIIKRKLNIQWITNARLDTINNILILKKMRQAGLWILGVGVESAKENIRGLMNKKLEPMAIEAGFKNLKKVGIKSYAFFILGYPGETTEDMQQTIDFALKLDPDFVSFYPAVPYPGTRFAKKCAGLGIIKEKCWRKLEYSNYVLQNKNLNDKIVLKMIARGYRQFYFRPKYLLRSIKTFFNPKTISPTIFSAIRFITWRLKI